VDSTRSEKMNRFASIDIGTNTVLMVIADISADGKLYPVFDGQQFPRLGKDVDAAGFIHDDSVVRVIEALQKFKRKAESMNVKEIFACGTSALRDAENSREVIRRIKETTDINVDIISGQTEAEYSYLGALSNLSYTPGRTGVLDIGGGSTELVIGEWHTVTSRCSIDIGCVRLTERFLSPLPPSSEKLRDATIYLYNAVREKIQNYTIDRLIGVAGTVTTLATVGQRLPEFSPSSIDGLVLTVDDIESFYATYSHYTIDDMKRIPQIPPGREDILLAGLLILKIYLSLLRQDAIIVSTRGLRYGQLLAHTYR
jgi:exopolyphosphatase / guanosine-5'-triphosphate,3'-diphosphate pyrophosphatase